MRTGIIVQARMTSTRLPGKVLMPVLGKPLLEYQIERLRRVGNSQEIIVATTTNVTDQPIVDLCRRLEVKMFRGPEEDVLTRYYEAAEENALDIVVRITSDCPLIDPNVVERVITFFLEYAGNYDYVSNSLQGTYPQGMDTEVFSYKALSEAYREAARQMEREHVTPFFYLNPRRYCLGNVMYKEDQSRHRWTVDTLEDFKLVAKIIEYFYPLNPCFTLEDILKLLNKNPDWFAINAHIKQKKLFD
ncbi:Spore coat polysaccharide biosynthesis protein F, CMP-KDO synthetase [Desulfitobacterium hafniense]|uniref:Spore coat polysaccharide biosynthesis protein F, CMP-KDO synthetase n=1 Tax=Desulfitobacterium hafniense TaxID=49338 RepID=A0A098B5J7_DESHA|nr:glycosyltransferase family protein [Desulfitobacterium hafniense]CDX03136.1 Spore coat polysaccharide biosynthesis protein F, CMP-KDO synthetase [Desulfitobacterium hafniense]